MKLITTWNHYLICYNNPPSLSVEQLLSLSSATGNESGHFVSIAENPVLVSILLRTPLGPPHYQESRNVK